MHDLVMLLVWLYEALYFFSDDKNKNYELRLQGSLVNYETEMYIENLIIIINK